MSVADLAMGKPGGRPTPTDQNLRLVVAVQSSLPKTRGQVFSFKFLTFRHFFV